MKRTTISTILIAVLISAPALAGPTYSFINISSNNVLDAAIGEAQLTVNVTDGGSGNALFTFGNSGPQACSITDIYFDDGATLTSIQQIQYPTSGVSFSVGATPGNLPAGSSIPSAFVADLSLDSDSPTSHNGINPGEALGVLVGLQPSINLDDVMTAIDTGSLRIGIHVQAFDSEGSESFITAPASPVPVPGAYTLSMIGAGLTFLLRKKH